MRNSDNLSDCKRWINSEPKNGQARMEHPFRKAIVLNLDEGCLAVFRDLISEYGWMICGVTGVPAEFEVEPGLDVKHICDRADVKHLTSISDYKFAVMKHPWSANNFKVNDIQSQFNGSEELINYNVSSLIGKYGLTPYDMLLIANKYKGKKFYIDFKGRNAASVKWFLKCIAKSADIELMCAIASNSISKQDKTIKGTGSGISSMFLNLYFGCWDKNIKEIFNSDMTKFELEKARTSADLRGIDRVIPKS